MLCLSLLWVSLFEPGYDVLCCLSVKWNFRQKCANESTEFWKSIEKYNLITSFLSREEWIIMVLALTFLKLLRSQGSPLPYPYGARERVGTRLFLKLSPILPRKFNEAGAAFLKGLHSVLKELTSPVQSGVEFTSVVRDWPISNFRCYSRLKRR